MEENSPLGNPEPDVRKSAFMSDGSPTYTPYEPQVITMADGREYTIRRDGSWIKTKEELKGKKRRRAERTNNEVTQ